MPDIPAEAVTAAITAYAHEAYCDGEPIEGDERVIRRVLEAAVPILERDIRSRIAGEQDPGRQLLEEAFFLRQYGERPPGGGNENRHDWERRAEAFLRSLPPTQDGNPVAEPRED